MSESWNVFVIIPFTPEFDEIYDGAIRPTFEALGYSISKADSTDTQQNILRDVIDGISNADLLVADLTNSNANVFYEAGIAHTLGTPTILITQSIDSVPFDLQAYHLIEYSTHFSDMDDFISELEDIGEGHLNGEIEFGNPVTDFGNVEIESRVAESETTEDGGNTENGGSSEDDDSSPRHQKGILDYAEEAEEVQDALTHSVASIVTETKALESRLVDHATRVEHIARSEEQVSIAQAQSETRRAASDIRRYVNKVANDVDSIAEGLDNMMEVQENSIDFADPTVDEHREALQGRQQGLAEFRRSVERATTGIQEFYYESAGIRGINKELDKAADELTNLLSNLISVLTSADARAERMIQLTDEKLSERSAGE